MTTSSHGHVGLRCAVCAACAAWQDFATELFTRQIESEQVCNSLRPGHDAAMCIGLPATNPNTMVLSHADAVEIAAATPKYAPAGSGGLPLPRSTVEAMCTQRQFELRPCYCVQVCVYRRVLSVCCAAFVAYARQQGVSALLRVSDYQGAVDLLTAGACFAGICLLGGNPHGRRRVGYHVLDCKWSGAAGLPPRRASVHPDNERHGQGGPHVRSVAPLQRQAGGRHPDRGRFCST